MPRARLKLAFNGIATDIARVPALDEMLTRVVTVDLFKPPQRERIREESVRLEAAGRQQRQITRHLPEWPTQTAVFNALALHRQMVSLGLASPYVTVREPPDDYKKLRRHKNRKFRFTPLDGYLPPEL